jgi:hypothetical protein
MSRERWDDAAGWIEGPPLHGNSILGETSESKIGWIIFIPRPVRYAAAAGNCLETGRIRTAMMLKKEPAPFGQERSISNNAGAVAPRVRGVRCRVRSKLIGAIIFGLSFLGMLQFLAAAEAIDVKSLLKEMVDLENLAERPQPFFIEATASSYSRDSHKGGEAWFANGDVGQYVRTETNDGRKEHVLADLKGPGAIARIWSANPRDRAIARFYFDG